MTKSKDPKELKPIKIDGREFLPLNQSVSMAQDEYITVSLRDGGIHSYMMAMSAKAIVIDEVIAEDILYRILRSGYSHYILAATLTEVGKEWTREEADRNALIFARLTDKEDKITMRGVIVSLVVAFFRSGGASSTTSPKSSATPKTKAE